MQRLFADVENVDIVAGDWSTLEQYAPFSLLFVDVREVMETIDVLADLLEPGGIAVLDDFVPSSHWPPIVDGHVDTVREQWLTDERFTAVEMLIDPDASLIIATAPLTRFPRDANLRTGGAARVAAARRPDPGRGCPRARCGYARRASTAPGRRPSRWRSRATSWR